MKLKKIVALTLSTLFALSFSACVVGGSGANPADSHKHTLSKNSAKSASCMKEGNIAYWTCSDCDKVFADSKGEEEITLEETVVAKLAHKMEKSEAREATCEVTGRLEYWSCTVCKNTFADEAGTKDFKKVDAYLGYGDHVLTHHPEVPVIGKENGVKEYWSCSTCNKMYADEACTKTLRKEELVIYSVMNIPDFTVEVPANRDPVVLQLTDTQIIYAEQARPGRDGVHWEDWAERNKDIRCYNYLREIITETDPDFIIITGDIIYGEFDDTGKALTEFITFMESFDIPWAPIFGNHDNESAKGADWQCEQFENAQNCLFEQRDLTGNGNYSVGIVQGGEIKRMFYMLDTNACGNASAASLANGHTKHDFVGFGADQIAWYTNSIQQLKQLSPDTKISFAYHIQQAVVEDAFAKYGFDNGVKEDMGIHIDFLPNRAEGDFGIIGRKMKGEWDSDRSVWNGMKALGVDSVFVGHEHCNSGSVVYDGVRIQYGQKSTEYDRFNCVSADGTITGGYSKTGTPLIGGSVIVLSKTDGAIEDAYIYYCKDAGGNIDWSKFIVYDVNGLKKGTDFYDDGTLTFVSTQFEGTNAYEIYANNQGKVYINPSLLRGKTTFTFSAYVVSGFNDLAGMGPFAIRLKPDDGSAANIAGVLNASGKYYIDYDVDSVEAAKIVPGTWQTFTVDITDIANTCTEFSFLVAQGNTVYIKDVAIS